MLPPANAPAPAPCPLVRQSTAADIGCLERWSGRGHLEPVSTKLDLIKRCHAGQQLLIYACPESDEALAYQIGGLLAPGMLEVRADCQRKGIGTKLALHCMYLAACAEEDILHIHYRTRSAVPFWTRLGFKTLGAHGSDGHAYRLLHRPLPEFADGIAVKVVISWYPRVAPWSLGAVPLIEHVMTGRHLGPTVYLPQRVLFPLALASDVVLKVEVGLDTWFFAPANYESAESLGVRRRWNGYSIDALHEPPELTTQATST